MILMAKCVLRMSKDFIAPQGLVLALLSSESSVVTEEMLCMFNEFLTLGGLQFVQALNQAGERVEGSRNLVRC